MAKIIHLNKKRAQQRAEFLRRQMDNKKQMRVTQVTPLAEWNSLYDSQCKAPKIINRLKTVVAMKYPRKKSCKSLAITSVKTA
ncbi:MAG: hypothetical protein Q7T18_03235 [Sedimentisphaerales bacterium]|nr:hypothetical protein [Sedimentisphaerales bacterium]